MDPQEEDFLDVKGNMITFLYFCLVCLFVFENTVSMVEWHVHIVSLV